MLPNLFHQPLMGAKMAAATSGRAAAFQAWSLVGVLLSGHIALLAWNAQCQSPTIDEPAHLVAGISYWKTGRFDLYSVNPPLVRLVAALPVIGMSPRLDGLDFAARPDVRPEFSLGRQFIEQNGERVFLMFTLARWSCIPFSVLGAVVCYRWTSSLSGRAAGLLALALWCFFPEMLAHGSLITADVPAAATGLLAGFLLWRWLDGWAWPHAAFAGLACGLAILTKTTWLMLLAVLPFLWIASLLLSCESHQRRWQRELAQLSASLVLALAVVNAGYLFQGSVRPLGDYDFLSKTFTGNPESSAVNRVSGNRFRPTWLAAVPVPVPAPLVQGLDLQMLDFENYMPVYLGGRFHSGGCWYAYLYIALVKWPIGFWLLLLLRVGDGGNVFRIEDSTALLVPAASLLAMACIAGTPGYSRYIVPALPFLFVWCAQLFHARSTPFVRRLPVWIASGWLIVSSLSVYPHSLGYFNEFAGGPQNGSAHLIDCNIDWGQDLFELKRWQESHPEASPLFVAYHGQVNPRQCGISFRSPHSSGDAASGSVRWEPGYYAISVQILRGGLAYMYDDQGRFWDRQQPDIARRFLVEKPVDQVGYSISIYRISETGSRRIIREPRIDTERHGSN